MSKRPSKSPEGGEADLSTRILEGLAAAGTPLAPAELAAQIELRRSRQDAFDEAVEALARKGKLIINRKGELCLPAKLDVVAGTVIGHPDGYGFLTPDEGGDDLFLSEREMHKVLHGDRAAARVVGVDRRGRPEGQIVDVLERANKTIVGRLHEERGVWFVVAENRRINQDLLIPAGERGDAKDGQVVVAEILTQPAPDREAVARVVEVLGNATDPGMEIEIALRKHALPFEFSADAKRAAEKLPTEVRAADIKGRRDLRDLPLVTIDGETARDFDDAVYCERNAKGFRLVVAIADVSHYVRDGDALDVEARERGNSVYFPRRVIPMLPEALSDELCSLKPRVDRLCMVCDLQVTPAGAIAGYTFYPAVMHSKARLTYTAVWEVLSDTANATSKDALAMKPQLDTLYALYQVLATARRKRGAIDFETIELALKFDDKGKIEAIVPAPRNDAHKLIEECMLAANVCTAAFLAGHKQPVLYRVHEGPTPEKLTQLKAFLSSSALMLTGGDKPTAMDYAKLIAKLEGRPDQALLQTVLLRSLQQAQYQPDNEGHFGLAYEAYAHFTSPIRRYPDLLVHRAIKAVLAGKKYVPKGATWEELGKHCSMTERRADEATRDVVNWLKCFYMQDKIGEVYDGTVSGVASFGLFVTLDGLSIDGLVHVTELGKDYFRYDAVRHALVGDRSGAAWTLAQRVRIRVARVDMETSKIDFTLATGEALTSEIAPPVLPVTGKAPPASSRPQLSQPLTRGDKPARTVKAPKR